MEEEIQKLEAELATLRPATLDPELADRLVRAVEARTARLDPAERAFEHELRGLQPSPPRDVVRAALAAVVERLVFPGPAKVVPFPVRSPQHAPRRRRRVSWAAAAAVALAGGLSALWVGPKEREAVASGDAPPRKVPGVEVGSAAFTPSSFESGVSDTRDLGRLWAGSERAMRVVKVIYRDRVVWLNEDGEEVVTEIPRRVEYLMMPEQVD